MGLWRFKIPNSMLLGLSYFLLNREMSDLGLHHIPKTLQRGNFFFRECPEGNRKNYRKLQTIQLPQVSLRSGLSLEQQNTTNKEFVVVTEYLDGYYKAQHYMLHFPGKAQSDFGEGSTRLRSQHLLDVTSLSTTQPEAPCTPSSQGTPAALCVCSGRLFALQSIPTVRYYLRVWGGTTPQTKPHKPHTYL